MSIQHIIESKEKDLGNFSVRRLLPVKQQRMVGPWIFFDHMGPAVFPAGKGIDVRPHPHINLATVTYLFEGEILHRDSVGSEQLIQPGDVNLMVAGSGITHSERERSEVRNTEHRLHGLQLWHALPEQDEEVDPAFYHYRADDLPCFSEGKTPLRLIIGSAYGFTSPVKTFADTLYLEAQLQQDNRLTLPKAEELAIYVVSGTLIVDQKSVDAFNMVVLNEQSQITVQALTDTRIAVIGGEKMSERFIEWNFVSSKKERIQQAVDDWRNGRFPKVTGDEVEFIPY